MYGLKYVEADIEREGGGERERERERERATMLDFHNNMDCISSQNAFDNFVIPVGEPPCTFEL